jgi:hypothetical protein
MNRGARDQGNTYLTNCKMAETTDELRLVERVGSHFHPAHRRHLAVHLKEAILGDLDLKAGTVQVVRVE